MRISVRRIWAVLPVALLPGVLLLATAGGCSAVPRADISPLAANGGVLPPGPQAGPGAMAGQPQPAEIQVELRRAGKDPQSKALTLQPGMTIQDALRESGVLKRIGRMDLAVERRGPDRQRVHLESHFNPNKKLVEPGYDYALHPDDVLVITEDNSTVIARMIESVSDLILPMARRDVQRSQDAAIQLPASAR
jgi:hypothetical protein